MDQKVGMQMVKFTIADNKTDEAYEADNTMPDHETLIKAKRLLAEGKIEESLKLVKNYWLENPDDADAASLFSDLMKESGRSELSKRLHSLADQLPLANPSGFKPLSLAESEDHEENFEDNTFKEKDELLNNKLADNQSTEDNTSTDSHPSLAGGKEFFEAGYSLMDARQPELAAMLLNRAVRTAPQDPTANYELGFALMSMKRFGEAIPHLEQALQDEKDFDTLLNLLVCYTLTRNFIKAQETLVSLKGLTLDEEQKKEVTHQSLVLKRLESFRNKTKLNSRDWLYILYGSILLRPSTKEDKLQEDPHSIGQLLAIMKGVLEGLSAMPETIEFYGPQSRPLAQALAEFLEIPITSYRGPEQPVQALLVMTWASDIIGPHKSFMAKEKNRGIFSYALTWSESLPVVPEIVGALADNEPMPWDENQPDPKNQPLVAPPTNQRNFAPPIEKAYKAILAIARDLECDPRTIKFVQEALDYYETKKQHLLLCNTDAFKFRPEYTAEIVE
jgi:tetratricopeptide (TPR) repeat protein